MLDVLVRRPWSELARLALIWSVIIGVVLSITDGFVTADYVTTPSHTPLQIMFKTWVYDFRVFAEQCILTAAVLLVGAKFFETRTIMTIGFDKLDAEKMSIKGPDEDNVIWIGRKYGSTIEAETVAAALESRLRESAE